MNSMHVDLRMIQHAATLASERSFAHAASRLHLSQPALSHSISKLEKRVGAKLFDRANGSVLPTEMGRLFLRHAEELLAKAADMGRALRDAGGRHSSELVVGAGIYPTEMFLGAAMAALAQHQPASRTRVVHGHVRDLVRLLQKREIELLVGDPFWMEGRDDMSAILMNAHQGYLVARAGHPLLSIKNLSVEQVFAQSLVCGSQTMPRLSMLALKVTGDPKLADQIVHWLPTVATESLSMMCSTVAASDAVAVLPLPMALAEVQRGRLGILPLVLPWLKVAFSVMRLAHHPLTDLGQVFLDAVKKADADLHTESQSAAQTLPALWKRQLLRAKDRRSK
jgi:DNA-binding transcriptional LysR family regulator